MARLTRNEVFLKDLRDLPSLFFAFNCPIRNVVMEISGQNTTRQWNIPAILALKVKHLEIQVSWCSLFVLQKKLSVTLSKKICHYLQFSMFSQNFISQIQAHPRTAKKQLFLSFLLLQFFFLDFMPSVSFLFVLFVTRIGRIASLHYCKIFLFNSYS